MGGKFINSRPARETNWGLVQQTPLGLVRSHRQSLVRLVPRWNWMQIYNQQASQTSPVWPSTTSSVCSQILGLKGSLSCFDNLMWQWVRVVQCSVSVCLAMFCESIGRQKLSKGQQQTSKSRQKIYTKKYDRHFLSIL